MSLDAKHTKNVVLKLIEMQNVFELTWMQAKYDKSEFKKSRMKIQAALVIRGGYVPQKSREYQNREYQVQ